MAAPVNDSIANAIAITGSSFTYSGSNDEATGETGEVNYNPDYPGEEDGSPLNTVWFSYTADTTGTAAFDTFGTQFDSTLAVYTASGTDAPSVTSLTPVAFNDQLNDSSDAPPVSDNSSNAYVSFAATAGTTYYLAVDGYSGGSGNYSLSQYSGPAGVVACYATGTRIETARGPVTVEELRAGDVVRTVSGRHGDWAPVRWIGFRQVDLLRHPRPERVQPVRICADALGDATPVRDLVVSPDHCMWIDGALVPAHFLINGDTIVQETARATVTYWHVELEQHDVLVAEGAAAESYLDTGNRHAFTNVGAAEMLHPDFEGADSAERLVPRLPADGGEVVRAVRARLEPHKVSLAA